MELGARHRALEFLALNDLAEERVGRQQHVVVEEDVVDADDAFLAQHDVGLLRVAAVHREPESEMRVVIEIRAGRDDPVDEAALDERNERRHAESGRRERAGERHADRDVGLEHLLREQLARFAQTRRVVGEEGVVDQIGGRLGAVDRRGIDARAAQELALLVRRVLARPRARAPRRRASARPWAGRAAPSATP